MAGVFLLGLVMLYLAGLCWTGRWRSWVEWYSGPFSFAAIPGFLAIGLLFVTLSLFQEAPAGPVDNLVLAILIVGFTGFAILMAVDPPWFGPRWYRQFRRAFDPYQPGSLQAWADDPRRAGETSVDATARHLQSERPRPPAACVQLINDPSGGLEEFCGKRGVLGYWPQAPLLSFSHVDKTDIWRRRKIGERIMGAEAIIAVQRQKPGKQVDGSLQRSDIRSYLVPRVRVDTPDGAWLFEARKAKKIVKELGRRYLASRPYAATETHGHERKLEDETRPELERRGV